MDSLYRFFNFIIHINSHLAELITQYGLWIYPILFLIIFCETGLVIFPFLPGDSLLFTAGTLAATKINYFNFHKILMLIFFAAILGDACNYTIGFFFGKKIVQNCNSILFNRFFLKKTYDYYKKHGKKTILFARFVPIVRTFAPFIAGIGQMDYTIFFIYNIIGGFCWVTLFLYAGYFFGQVKFLKNYFNFFTIVLIFLSIFPIIIKILKQKNNKKHQINNIQLS